MVNGWLSFAPAKSVVARRRTAAFAFDAKQDRFPTRRCRRCAGSGRAVIDQRGLVLGGGLQRGEAAFEIGLEVIDILEPDVKPQRGTARRPFGRRAVAVAVEGN